MRQLVRDLNIIYRSRPALHARDCEADGFSWLIVDDSRNSVFAWLRKAPEGNPVAVIANLTPVVRENYRVPLPAAGEWREIVNTDAEQYGGSGKGNAGLVTAIGPAVIPSSFIELSRRFYWNPHRVSNHARNRPTSPASPAISCTSHPSLKLRSPCTPRVGSTRPPTPMPRFPTIRPTPPAP